MSRRRRGGEGSFACFSLNEKPSAAPFAGPPTTTLPSIFGPTASSSSVSSNPVPIDSKVVSASRMGPGAVGRASQSVNDEDDDYDLWIEKQEALCGTAAAAAAAAAGDGKPKALDRARLMKRTTNVAAAQAGAQASFPAEKLFHAGDDNFAHLPSDESAELLLSLPQICFENIARFAPRNVLKLVCRRWLCFCSQLRLHWAIDSTDLAIARQQLRIGSLVRLDLNDTTLSLVGLDTIARTATSLCFIDLSHCICLTDPVKTLSLLATATRLRQIELTGTAIAPPSDAICALTAIQRLQRLTFDGVADIMWHETAASTLPSLAAVLTLLDKCSELRVQFRGAPPVIPAGTGTEAAPAAPCRQQVALDTINANSRVSFVRRNVPAVKVWPTCRVATCSMPCFLATTHPATGEPLECDSCGATPKGSDFLMCKRHTTLCGRCFEASPVQ